jgi:hypothetical protein
MSRFVVLHHKFPDSHPRTDHWDLMIEQNGELLTWALAEPLACGSPISATRLAPHRLAYLDYEGPVSGDRGAVKRVASGEASILVNREDRFEANLLFAPASSEEELAGTIILTPQKEADSKTQPLDSNRTMICLFTHSNKKAT